MRINKEIAATMFNKGREVGVEAAKDGVCYWDNTYASSLSELLTKYYPDGALAFHVDGVSGYTSPEHGRVQTFAKYDSGVYK